MVDDELGKSPDGDEKELLKAVMTRLRGGANPKDIVNRIRSARHNLRHLKEG
jgi:hypothetical protein